MPVAMALQACSCTFRCSGRICTSGGLAAALLPSNWKAQRLRTLLLWLRHTTFGWGRALFLRNAVQAACVLRRLPLCVAFDILCHAVAGDYCGQAGMLRHQRTAVKGG